MAGDPGFLTDSQRELMAEVLDQIVPREGELPGAGELGVAEHLDTIASEVPSLRRLFSEGLRAIEMTSLMMHSKEFPAMQDEAKAAVLRQVESEHPAFFQTLVHHTYGGYYTSPKTIRLLGLEERPPQPGGYLMEPFDLRLLENVRKRGKLYREA